MFKKKLKLTEKIGIKNHKMKYSYWRGTKIKSHTPLQTIAKGIIQPKSKFQDTLIAAS